MSTGYFIPNPGRLKFNWETGEYAFLASNYWITY